MMKQEEDSKSSSNDIVREEMPWEAREEKLVTDVIADCKSRELYHEKKRKFCKFLYILFDPAFQEHCVLCVCPS